MTVEYRDPIIDQMRAVREQLGLSLQKAGLRAGMGPMVIGSYERGDRVPPLPKLRRWVESFGYKLLAVPNGVTTGVGSPLRIEYAVRYGQLGDGLIECDSLDEAVTLVEHMPGAQVVHRTVRVSDWQVGRG